MLDDTYRFGEFSLSLRKRRLFQGETCVLLGPKAFDALHLLVRNHGSLVARSKLFSTLWPRIHVTEANLTNIIVLLRKRLGRDAIQTVSKFGYRFTLPVTGEPGINQAAYAGFVRGKELLGERSPESHNQGKGPVLVLPRS
jgi:DNA-binding winged helix-turn-helix (wHTH) protein